ncbi:MAG: GHKL domain-containing protein [Erysipelotrichaceae bacterium]
MENITMFFGIAEEIFNIINQILLMYIFRKFELKVDFKRVFLILFALSLSFALGMLFSSKVLTLLINIFIQFLAFMKIVDIDKKKRCIYFFFTLILQAFFVTVVQLFFKNILNIQASYNLNSMFIAIFLFVIIAIAFLYKKNKYNEDSEEINHYVYIFLTIGFLSGSLMMMVVHLFGNKFSVTMNIALLILAFITIIANIIVYVLYIKKYKENLSHKAELISLERVLNMQERYFRDTIESYKELREFRHDISGYFNTIERLIFDEKYNELHALTKNLKNTNQKSVQNSCSNIYISATLHQFMYTLKEESIKFSFQYDVLEELVVENNHLCSLIYNLMSNAVEACKKCIDDREIKLIIYQKNRALIFKVSNTVDDSFRLSNLKVGNSSKKNKFNHGIGLKNINNIVEKYNGNIDFELINNKLVACVILLHGV